MRAIDLTANLSSYPGILINRLEANRVRSGP